MRRFVAESIEETRCVAAVTVVQMLPNDPLPWNCKSSAAFGNSCFDGTDSCTSSSSSSSESSSYYMKAKV